MQDAPDLFVDLDAIDPETIFASGGAEAVIVQIEECARAAARSDLSTATARGVIAAVAYKVARTKTALDDAGKDHVADLKRQAKAVDVERKSIRDRLDVLRDDVRKPLTDWEHAEEQRIDELRQALAEIEATGLFDVPEPAPAEIQDRLDRLSRLGGNRDWQEFATRADVARSGASAKLAAMLAVAQRREAERAELETLRQKEAQRADNERIAKAAEETTTRTRLEAAADVTAANQRADNAVAEARRTIEAEQDEDRRTAEARASNREHRAKVNAAVRDCLCAQAGLSPDLATAVVVAIARGHVANVSINY
jgi:hypothetical protein